MATMSGGANLGVAGGSQAGSGTFAQRKKDGSPSARFWESPDTAAQLEVVRQWIGKQYKKVVSCAASRPLLAEPAPHCKQTPFYCDQHKTVNALSIIVVLQVKLLEI